MAVTQIRKISSRILTASVIISIIVVAVFWLSGSELTAAGQKSYLMTDLLLYWTYIMFFVSVVVAIAMAAASFVKSFKQNRKRALVPLFSVLLLAVVMLLSYVFGSADILQGLNEDSAKFNTPGWLKLTDMMIGTIYVLFGLVVIAIIWGAVRRMTLSSKK